MGMLDGVKVPDFTHAYAGPFCTMTMADFGAQVIKIEKVSGGDQARSLGPFKNGYSGYYASFNRGKKSLPLDLRAPEAKEIIRRLIAESDIICSNFKADQARHHLRRTLRLRQQGRPLRLRRLRQRDAGRQRRHGPQRLPGRRAPEDRPRHR